MSPPARGRSFAALLLVAALLCVTIACDGQVSTPEPGPVDTAVPRERVLLQTKTATNYYTVRGVNSDSIFDYIKRNGPVDEAGQRGIGLTEVKWSYEWKGASSREGCGISTLTLGLDVTVTLPKHESPETLSVAVLKSWEKVAADVANHEQRHVEIYLAGAETMKGKLASIPPKPACDLLEKDIVGIWAQEQKAIDEAQERFHGDEDARLASQRAPLQAKIDSNRSRLSTLNGQIRTLDGQVVALGSELKETEPQLASLKAQMESIELAYGNDMPPSIAARHENLRQQYNSLASRYNAAADRRDAALTQRSRLVTEADQLVGETNDLVDTLNWTR
jgi:predicted secreted Zn-dependent protease